MIDLDGRRAVITGASRGIGYAVAEAYANAGAEVHIVSESGDIEEAAAVLRSSANASLTGHVGDVSDRLVRRLAESIAPPGILVNNAGLEELRGSTINSRPRRSSGSM